MVIRNSTTSQISFDYRFGCLDFTQHRRLKTEVLQIQTFFRDIDRLICLLSRKRVITKRFIETFKFNV
jgi:hypothetical protein